jgi:hypothetical protein
MTIKRAVAACLLVCLSHATGFAQAITGSINGAVEDASGAAVPTAKVTLIDTETSVERSMTVNERGDFVFNSVPPGEYSIKIEAPGFKTFQIPSINLTASEKLPSGTNNWDLSLLKSFVVYRERARIEFRAEAYNAFNHTQYTTLDTTARFNPATGAHSNATFGQVTAAASPRIMQLALRFLF